MIVFKQAITSVTTDLTDLYPTYDIATAYNSSDKVSYNGFYWELIPSTATGQTPSETSLYWEKIGVSNIDSIIDLRSTTKSTKNGGFYIEFPVDYDYTYLAIGYYQTRTLKIEALDATNVVVKTYLDEIQSPNENVFDYYDYIYEPYSLLVDRTRFLKLINAGTKIRVTFGSDVSVTDPECGFVLAGRGINLGKAMGNIDFKLNSYSTRNVDDFGIMTVDKKAVQNLVDFETTIDKGTFMAKRNEIKKIYDDFTCFIIDENDANSDFVGIGIIENASQLYDEYDKSIIGFSVLEAI